MKRHLANALDLRCLIFALAFGANSLVLAKTADQFPTECLGPESASDNLIFLHAILTEEEIKQGLPYQTDLQNLADKLRLRIAVPRSTNLCKTGSKRYCWGSEDPASIRVVYDRIIRSSAKCFKHTAPFILAGFSNGGYHAARAAMLCLSPQPRQILAFGSAGNPALLTKGDRKSCAPIFLAIGSRDISKSKARAFAEALTKAGEKIEFEEFTGGHVLPVDLLRSQLKKLIKR